ncbi:MAG: 50S ribosomal protein L10 [Bryobacterales bacterium]|nr:50S ribosomal protein L10 [Acidobacteriota bacterium]MCB9385840.1 50S ribosomal protein L10 [Bryobacterales bacterium]
MKTRNVKQAELDSLRQAFAENPVVVLCSFQGIKVDEDFQLRKKIRETGASYRVINNRLAKIAADGTPVAKAFEGLKGMTSLVLADDDPVGLMKALVEQVKTTKVFGFRAGVVEGQILDEKGLDALSKMPGKPETQSKILFLLNSGAQNMVGVLNAPARDLVRVLQAAIDENRFAE